MTDRFQRQVRVAQKMEFIASSPPFVLVTMPEQFFRSIIDDLQKLSYAFLDDKLWMEAGGFLTQALVMYDILSQFGFRKRDDSKKEENVLLLRAACGMKLRHFDIALKDSKHVLNGDPDNRYAEEIQVLAECEGVLTQHRNGEPHLRTKLEGCRKKISRLSNKPFQWDKAHFERVTAQIDEILQQNHQQRQSTGSAKPPSWANICKEPQAPKTTAWGPASTASKTQTGADEKWLPKQGLPKQPKQQPVKQAKTKKKKSRSRRQNRPRREVEVQIEEDSDDDDDDDDDDDYDDSELESVSSDRPNQSKKSDVVSLDVSKALPAVVNGTIPKTSPPRGQTAPPPVVRSMNPPVISDETRAWLAGYDFRLACQKCFYQVPNEYGLYSFRFLQNPTHKPHCQGGMLVCRLHVPPRNGLREVFGRIRPRTKPDFKGTYTLCQQNQAGVPCKISTESCWFPHSVEEMDVWEADRKGLFKGREVVASLRYKLNQEIVAMQNKQAASQANRVAPAQNNKAGAVHASQPLVQPPGAYPHHPPKKPIGTQQPPGAYPHQRPQAPSSILPEPPAVVRTLPPTRVPQTVGPGPGGDMGRAMPPGVGPGPLPVERIAHTKIVNLIKKLGGQFIFLCRHCFDGAPQILSVQNPQNPARCTGGGEKSHPWDAPSRCVVHRLLCKNGQERFWKVRKRPSGIPPKAFLCWHRNKTYGCPTGSKCHFAHNEIEVVVWEFEAYHPLDRKLLVAISDELTYGPVVQKPMAAQPRPGTGPGPAATPMMQAPSQPIAQPTPPPRPVFPHKIKIVCGLCFTKSKQLVERNPRRPTHCAAPMGHEWGKNLVYAIQSPSEKRWVRILGRHPRLRPEIEPVLCWRGSRCQFREMFSNQCMFPHSEEERLLWIYQAKAKVKSIEEVVEIQRQASAPPAPRGVAGDAVGGARAAPRGAPNKMLTSQFLCSYCNRPFRTKHEYDSHTNSMEHKMRIKSDAERSWKYRSPPLNVTDGKYQICTRNLKNSCNYSGVVQERNDCPLAHSVEELEEWKERHEYRMMKIAKAKEQKLYSFVDELLTEYNLSSTAEHDVMTEQIPGLSAECKEGLKPVLPIKEKKHGEEITHKWDFEVHSARKNLRRVGLLYDEHRLHFHLSNPKDEHRPQVCPGGILSQEDGMSFKITVHFHTHILGLFHQWVVFDFGEKPVLVRKLSIHIGSSLELERYAKQRETQKKIKLWDSGNSQIIKFVSPSCETEMHSWEKTLVAEYKQPSTLSGLEDVEEDRRMNSENYRIHMHRMLNLEELECMDRLTKYCTATEMTVSPQAEFSYPYGTNYAQHGELYGTIKLEHSLFDDSEASQIVQQKVSRVLIKFNQETDVVYEALIMKNTIAQSNSDDIVCVQLSKQCVDEQNLVSHISFGNDVGNKSVPVIVQFQLDRLPFVYMHHAVDHLSCMTVLFPPYPQKDKFEIVKWHEVEHRAEKMNPRQEKAARYICSAGGLRGNPSFRGKGPVIIFGPFGTGKTYTMAKSIMRTLLIRNDSRILICTQSNSAADLYITEHLHQFCQETRDLVRMVRMYAVERQKSTISETVMKYVLLDEAGNLRHPYDDELHDWAAYAKTQHEERRRTPNIVIATLRTAVHLTRDDSLREYFTHIIIDEAGQALETEAIIPLQLATNDTCVVLAGDHKQISPKVYSARARQARFDISLLQRLFTFSRQKHCYYDLLLTYNYRTCAEILDFLAVSYYRTRLEARGSHPKHPLYYPLNFYLVKGEDRLVGTSYVNNQEMLQVAFIVQDLIQNWPPSWGELEGEKVAVLTAYTLQVHLIRKELRRRGLGSVTVDTVQNVQGKQFRAIVISTVRTRETLNKAHITAIPQGTGTQHESEFYYAFLSDEHLLNTAFTRAKSLIIVVGDPVALCSVGSCHMTWVRYLQECQRNNSIVPQETTMEMIQEEIAAAKQRLNPSAATFHPRKAASTPTRQKGASAPSVNGKTQDIVSSWNQGQNIWTKSTTFIQPGASGHHAAYMRLNSDEFPTLPEANARGSLAPENIDDSGDDDEFEDFEQDIQDDDLLEELRRQVQVDTKEELRERSETGESTEEDAADSEIDSSPEPSPPRIVRRGEDIPEPQFQDTFEVNEYQRDFLKRPTPLPDQQQDFWQHHQQTQPPPPLQQQQQPLTQPHAQPQTHSHHQVQPQAHGQPQAQPQAQPETNAQPKVQPQAHAQRTTKPSPAAQPAAPPVANVDLQNNAGTNFRMVERAGRIALLPRHLPRRALSQVEDYDSDEDEPCGEPGGETEDTYLEKTVTEPEKFKICTFRYDFKGMTYAIPVERKALEVISITSKKRRGQALDNDEVIIEIIEDTEVPEILEGVEESVQEEEDNKIYGKVVHILKRDTDPYLRKIVCTLDPFSNNLMVPVDRTFPKLFIVKNEEGTNETKGKNVVTVTIHTISREAAKTRGKYQPERNVYVTNKERPHKLFVVRFWKWYPKTPYPMGVVVEELEPGTTAKQGLHILKLVHGVKDKFKVAVDNYLQANFPPEWTIPKAEYEQRPNLTDKKIFTIDPQDSEDLDDAVSVVVLGQGRFEVGVHIADVSYFIPKGSELDEEARLHATSFYPSFHEKPIHMLPRRLSTELCSLQPGKDKLALSLIVVLDSLGRPVAPPNVYRSIIRSCQKLSYSQAEDIIHGDCPEGLEDLVQPIRILHDLASKKRAARLGEKRHIFNAEDDDGDVKNPLSHSLIEEFMIMANQIIGEHLLTRYGDCTPLRRQLAPDPERLEEWKVTHKDGVRNSIWLTAATRVEQDVAEDDDESEDDEPTVPITKEVWKELVKASDDDIAQKGLDKVRNLVCIDANHPLQAVALSEFHHIMERSEYINSADHLDPAQRSHYSLQLQTYVHFTSPIRRFIDLVVHRLLINSLAQGFECPYEARELANITHHCTSRAFHAQRFSKESQSLQLALKLQEAPLQLLSFVEAFSDRGLKLQFPHRPYILPMQSKMNFNTLKPSKRPETGPESDCADLLWKNRIYDYHGQQRQGLRRDAMELDARRWIVHVPEDNWEDIQNSVKSGDFAQVKRAVRSAVDSGNPELNQFADMMSQFSDRSSSVEVTCEYVNESGTQQMFIDFHRPFRRGDINQVQMYARLFKGVITPHIQLFNLTPMLDICAEHRDNPVSCFSDVATTIPGREKSIVAYKKAWLPIISMVNAHDAVANDDTIVIHNVTITWQELEGHNYQGYFNLPFDFLEQRDIHFFQPAKDDKKQQEEEEDVQFDFLCIRYPHLQVSSRKHLRMRELDSRSKKQEAIGPYNRHAWSEQTFVAHGHTTNVQSDSKAQLMTVTFQLHTTSIPFPKDVLLYQAEGKQRTCTVELIPVPEPGRRLDSAIRSLPDSTALIRSICLHKTCKPSDDQISKIALDKGAKFKNFRVEGTTLHPLNRSQQEAVQVALKSSFSVIQGPPGTGKTVTGAYLAYFFTLVNQHVPPTGKGRPQVLYCGPSNKAVDVIASYLLKFDISVVRVYSEMIENKEFPLPGMPSVSSKWRRANEAGADEDLKDITLHRLIRRPGAPYAADIRAMELKFSRMTSVSYAEKKKYKKLLLLAMEEELKKHSVVLCTCNAAGAGRIRKYTNIIQCIVDEAGMCNEPETLIPLTNTLPHQIVLIGDHKQLRPIITENNARDLGMEESLLEKYQKKAKMLTIQYRMHEAICAFPSQNFYEDKLETDQTVKSRSPDPLRAIWPNKGRTPTVFCHVYGKEETLTVKSEEGNEMSKSNMAEVMHATRIVAQLLKKGAMPRDIVVLSQYKLQCTQIEQRLKEKGIPSVKVSTVVTSQGSEWDYVVLSTVRSKPRIEIDDKPGKGWQRKHLGFIIDENQMNVALTRAKRGLIIIGNQHLLETHHKWKELLKKYRDQDCVMEARNFPPFRS
ncbi:3'-5' exoribonuclease HELZ2-like [Diadema antillarum]|uniref:3'-5' exoribonuclease HELZ2-like n=1 Tax=Diadema antillarum TaxID=105358 RepID=UPI003A86BABE